MRKTILPPPQTARLPDPAIPAGAIPVTASLPQGVLPDLSAAHYPPGVVPDAATAGLPDGVIPDVASVRDLVSPAGELVGMPVERVSDAFQQGYRLPTQEDLAAYARHAEFGTVPQQLATAGEAAASALTFGAFPAIETATGLSTPERIRARAQENPISHMFGTGVGIAAPMIATAGAAAPAEAGAVGAMGALRAGAELTAPRLIGRAGKAAAGLLGENAPRLAGVATAGAVEGSLYAASDAVERALLKDPALTWEGAATELGLGALFGGALGAGTDVAAKGLGTILTSATKGLETVAQRLAEGDKATIDLLFKSKGEIAELEKVAPGAADAIAASTPETAAFVIKNRAKIEKLEQTFPGVTGILTQAAPDTRQLILDRWPELIRDPQDRMRIGTSLVDAVNTAYGNVETALRKVNATVRPSEIENLAQGVDPQQAQASFVRLYSTVDALAQKMRAEPDLFQASAARELELIRDGMARDAQGLADQLGVRSRTGKVVTPQIPDGEPIEYRAIEADRLIPSHTPNSFTADERFPRGVQERDYRGQRGEQLKVENGARELDPSLLLTDTPSALDGPPLVTDGTEHYVMGGNGRSLMLLRAIAEHPDRYDAYRKELLSKVEQFGIPRTEIAGMESPVLVRVLHDVPSTASKPEMIAAVRRLNEGMTQQLSPIARAIAESRTMSAGTVESLGEILGTAGDKSLRDVLRESPESIVAVLRRDGIVNAQNEAQWLQGGQLSDAAKDRIEGMFLGRIFDSEQRYSATAPELVNKIERAAPSLLKVAGQTPQHDQIATVRSAIDLLSGAKSRGLALDDYLFERTHQGSMLGTAEAPVTRDAIRMAKLLDANGQRAVQQRFGEWAEHLSPQGSLFGPKVKPTAKSADAILFAGVKVPKAGSLGAKAMEATQAPPPAAAEAAPVADVPAAGAAAVPAPPPEKVLHPSIPPAQVFSLLNRTKQLIDAQARFGKSVSPEWRRTAGALKGLRTGFKKALEDADVWGAAGERQREFNGALNDYLTARNAITNGPAFQKLMQKITTRTGAVEYEANPRSIDAWINAMASNKGAAKSDNFASYLKASRTLADEMERSGYPDSERIRRVIYDATGRANDIRERGYVTNLVEMLSGKPIRTGMATPTAQQMLLAAAKRLPGGVGSLISLSGTLQKVRRPGVTVGVIAALDKYAQRASAKLRAGADAIFQSGASGAAAGESAGQRFSDGGIVTPERFNDVAGALRGYGGSLDQTAGHVAAETSLLQNHAPVAADAAHAFAARVVGHLASKLPTEPGKHYFLDPAFEPSPSELAEFNEHHEIAARGPAAVLEHVARGTLVPSHLEASQKIYPLLHREAQQLVFDALAAHSAAGGYVPIDLRDSIGDFLGNPLDYSHSPEAAYSAQQAYSEPDAPSQQPTLAPAAGRSARNVVTRGAERLATNTQGTAMHLARG